MYYRIIESILEFIDKKLEWKCYGCFPFMTALFLSATFFSNLKPASF